MEPYPDNVWTNSESLQGFAVTTYDDNTNPDKELCINDIALSYAATIEGCEICHARSAYEHESLNQSGMHAY